MSKAAEVAKVSAKGSFHLLWGLVASTVISALGTIFVARLLVPSEYGLYTIALTAPNLIQNFRDWGINAAMIKYAAQYYSEKQTAHVKSVLFSGLVFETVLGLALSLLSFVLSDFLATSAFGRPGMTPLIQVASFVILTGAFLTTAQAAFVGLERMELNSITLVSQSIIKSVLVPALVIMGLGVFGAVIGYTLAFLIAGLIGILLMWMLYRGLPRQASGKLEVATNIKTMFKYGSPLSIGVILLGFLIQFYNFLIAVYASDAMVGNYAVANNFVVLITFFATPVTTVLFPAFSKLDAKRDNETLRNVFQFSVKYGALLVVPAAAIVMSLSQQAVYTLFGEQYGAAPLFLRLLALGYLYSTLGNLSVANLLNAQGETSFNLKLTILTVAIGFPLSFALTSRFGVLGMIVTTLIAGLPSLVIGLHWIRRRYGFTVDWISSARILLSSAAAAVVTYSVVTQLSFSSWVNLIIGVAIFLPTLIIALLATRTINRSDLRNLREMTSDFGRLRRFINSFLTIIEKLMNALRL